MLISNVKNMTLEMRKFQRINYEIFIALLGASHVLCMLCGRSSSREAHPSIAASKERGVSSSLLVCTNSSWRKGGWNLGLRGGGWDDGGRRAFTSLAAPRARYASISQLANKSFGGRWKDPVAAAFGHDVGLRSSDAGVASLVELPICCLSFLSISLFLFQSLLFSLIRILQLYPSLLVDVYQISIQTMSMVDTLDQMTHGTDFE